MPPPTPSPTPPAHEHTYGDWTDNEDGDGSGTGTHSQACTAPDCPDPELGKSTLPHTWQTTWTGDESAHWYACSQCGAKKDEASHEVGPVAAPIAQAVEGVYHHEGACAICGQSDPPPKEPCTIDEEAWVPTADNAQHGHTCAQCGRDPVALENHSYTTHQADGSFACVCGAALTPSNPATASLGDFVVTGNTATGEYQALGAWKLDWAQTPGDPRSLQYSFSYNYTLTSEGDTSDEAKRMNGSLSISSPTDIAITLTGLRYVEPGTVTIETRIFYEFQSDGESAPIEYEVETNTFTFTYTAGTSLSPDPTPTP